MVERVSLPASDQLPSLITYNCASANFYQQMGSPYLSPLIGHLFRSWQDYIELLSDLPGHLSAEPVFGEPQAPRYPASNRNDYPVVFLKNVEIHWMHAWDPPVVRHRLATGLSRMDWNNVVVSFSEANLGPAPLSDAEWAEFAARWNALPYRKLFFSTGRYGPLEGSVELGRWRGLTHFDPICGRDDFLCKPSCPGCQQPRWGRYTQEAVHITRALGLEAMVQSQGPFGPPDKGGIEVVVERGL